jgi:hypothetical protein
MGNTDSNKDDVPKQDEPKPSAGKPEKSPHPTHPKHDKYCPYSLYIPMKSTSINNFQSNCSTMIWHWDKIAPYSKPLKKG